jgi:hypothetical protein
MRLDVFVLPKYSRKYFLFSGDLSGNRRNNILSTATKNINLFSNKISARFNCECIPLLDVNDIKMINSKSCCFCKNELRSKGIYDNYEVNYYFKIDVYILFLFVGLLL